MTINACSKASGKIKLPFLLTSKVVSQSSNFPLSHVEAMHKMVYYLSVRCCQPQVATESVSQLIKLREFYSKKRESSVKQNPVIFFIKSSDII